MDDTFRIKKIDCIGLKWEAQRLWSDGETWVGCYKGETIKEVEDWIKQRRNRLICERMLNLSCQSQYDN